MKVLGLVVVFTLAAATGCTKQNPNLCCTDEADCAAQGLSNDSQCADGLLCRGNQCIAVSCSASSECDASAPYCVNASCSEACVGDEQCPGFGQSMAPYCVAGACVECRADVATDCGSATPVCDGGACRACNKHDECASGACGTDGACVSESAIAYVDVTGSGVSDCSKASPCNTLTRALQQSKTYIVVSSGTYPSNTLTTINGQHVVIGRGTSKPVLTRTTPGSVISTLSGELTVDNLEIRGGSSTTNDDYGAAILCTTSAGATKVHLVRSRLTANATGVRAQGCALDATECSFTANGSGVQATDSTATFDRCNVEGNGSGLILDGGLYQVTNSFIVRNTATGIAAGVSIYSNENGTKFEFNTVVDNAAVGFECNLQNVTGSFPNNIIARNGGFQTTGPNCSYPSSIIGATVTDLKFKSPDASPYDYHLSSGSVAIDAATLSSIATDFDGDARPTGAGRDVGADEFVP